MGVDSARIMFLLQDMWDNAGEMREDAGRCGAKRKIVPLSSLCSELWTTGCGRRMPSLAGLFCFS